MALARPSPAKTHAPDPTESLKQALQRFENALTNDRRQLYQRDCAKPDATSVVTFVTQLDQNDDGRAKQCFAPRLFTFLNATRQFTDAVDTFVSTNPHIAGLVWGGVKIAILAASNVASYFEKITDLIMRIGRICPVYDDFGSLYPGAVGLQAALCRFYAAMIDLCTKIILGSQRTLWQQVLSPIANPFEAEFRSFIDQLQHNRREVELQILLASQQADREMARLLELDRQRSASNWLSALQYHKEGRKDRDQAALWRKRQRAREEVKIRSSIRDNLSSIDHDKPWKQALRQRVSNTAEWFAADSNFLRWKDGQKTATLWCSGKLGTGKSILFSNIVAHLSMRSTASTNVAHFFCRSDDLQTTKARNILGSVSRQLLNTYIESSDGESLDTLLAETCDLDLEGVTKLISTRLFLDSEVTYYVLLDGLDECEPFERKRLARALAHMTENHQTGLKILCAARPDTENEMSKFVPANFRLTLTTEDTNNDITKYIEAALDACLEDGRLKLGDPTLIVAISQALQKGSLGMFLWTRLMIDDICDQENDNAIRHALEDLPRQLSDIFDRKLARIARATRSALCTKLLQFCGVTTRPLTLEEFREALGIELGQETLDRCNLPNDVQGIIASCHGLIYADEEEATIHYVHHSVKQHLFDFPGTRSARFDMPAIDKYLGLLCMTYLNFNELRGEVDQVGRSIPIDPIAMGRAALDAESDLTSSLARLILSMNRTRSNVHSNDLKKSIQRITGTTPASKLRPHFSFLPYAKQNWIHHLRRLQASDGEDNWRLFCKCVAGEVHEADRPWHTYAYQGLSPHMVSLSESVGPLTLWATSHDHQALLSEDFQRSPDDLEAPWYVVESANKQHQEELLELIVNNPLSFDKDKLASALMMAIDKDAVKLTEVCLKAGANPNAVMCYDGSEGKSRWRTPLQLAAGKGSSLIVDLLLDKGANANHVAVGFEGRTALQAAAERGHMDVVMILVRGGADVKAAPALNGGITAIQAATMNGHDVLSEYMLDSLARLDPPSGKWLRPPAVPPHLLAPKARLWPRTRPNTPRASSSTEDVEASLRYYT
ncbi:hypothetical protein LTR10_021382 [Elasticomyces elasticus]|uniref:NACHT domain-containing protein n=1 Tax=Exophiala sideris TaxID=1016849 RepID=A0ABR0JGW1_9EURO|nr:hypothetical protein LTR10_021382 [Elasticomyces elasticus]KAK5033398.1 hypothetical protein LTS07_003701 [Exophiala sideris]KAK5042107.1 hypothetical protein LTR13_001913 [Exophiala sideris]KAK5063942.1 hypothetical protein LTR69_003709 [Exophiala sideris]KAK5185375.1 hypothetical protein LTR44_002364 [Eurotiomycetes sp. CCFEE 6388]